MPRSKQKYNKYHSNFNDQITSHLDNIIFFLRLCFNDFSCYGLITAIPIFLMFLVFKVDVDLNKL